MTDTAKWLLLAALLGTILLGVTEADPVALFGTEPQTAAPASWTPDTYRLAAWYEFAGSATNSSGKVVSTYGAANHATPTALTYDSAFGGCVSLNGSSSKLVSDASFGMNVLTAATAVAWIKRASNSRAGDPVHTLGSGTLQHDYVGWSDGNWYTANNGYNTRGGTASTNWQLVVTVSSGVNTKSYLNGSGSCVTAAWTHAYSADAWRTVGTSGYGYFSGKLDSLAVYTNRVLTPTEIQAIWTNTKAAKGL